MELVEARRVVIPYDCGPTCFLMAIVLASDEAGAAADLSVECDLLVCLCVNLNNAPILHRLHVGLVQVHHQVVVAVVSERLDGSHEASAHGLGGRSAASTDEIGADLRRLVCLRLRQHLGVLALIVLFRLLSMVDVIQSDVRHRINPLRAPIVRHMLASRRRLFAHLKFLIFLTLMIALHEALLDQPVLLHIHLFFPFVLEFLVIVDVLDV